MDLAVLLALQSARIDGITQLAALISALGNGALIWIVGAIIFFINPDRRPTALVIVAVLIICFIGGELILSNIVARVRPCDAAIGITAVTGVSRAGFSFPSWHALSSFAAATSIALMLGKRPGTPAVILAVLISFSRLYLGVEYPTDVIGGAVIGALLAAIIVWAYNTFFGYTARERMTPKGRHSR